MTTFQLAMGSTSVMLAFAAYTVYFWQAIRPNSIQPHPFSWLLWSLVTGVAYLVQYSEGGGAGSWVTGLTAIICLLIAIFSLAKHRWSFSMLDWLSLAGGLLVFGYYISSKQPTTSAVLATLTDVIGYTPTIKKGWSRPHTDSITSFVLNSVKFIPAMFALNSYSIATCLYPCTIIIVNALVAWMLWRRRYEVAG